MLVDLQCHCDESKSVLREGSIRNDCESEEEKFKNSVRKVAKESGKEIPKKSKKRERERRTHTHTYHLVTHAFLPF